MKNFKEIKKFKQPNYKICVSLDDLIHTIERYKKTYNCDFDPVFQRGFVWTEKQQIEFVEYFLKGGFVLPICLNKQDWLNFKEPVTLFPMQLIDGKQRLNALTNFLNDDLPIFGGCTISQIENLYLGSFYIDFMVNNLSEKDAVEWYISMNTGGSCHTESEINKAKEYLNTL